MHPPATDPTPPPRTFRWAGGVFLVTLFAYGLTAGGHLYSPDEELLFRMTRSLFEDRDLAIEPFPGGEFSRAGGDGREYAQYGVGQPLLALPFYAAGKLLAAVGTDAGWRAAYGIPETGAMGAPGYARESGLPFAEFTAAEIAPRFACSFFNLFVGAAAASILFLILFELTGHRPASLLATALYAFGSMAWPHSRPFFSEPAAALSALVAWYAILRSARGRPLPWLFAAGLATGMIALIHIKAIFLFAGLGAALLGPIRRAAAERGRLPQAVAAFCAPALLCGAILLGLNWAHFGGPFETGHGDQPEGINFSTPLLAGLHGFLFTPGKGMFFFSPALALGLFGWGAFARRARPWLPGVALCVIVPLLAMAKWINWPGGWCWGPRHIFVIHAFLAIPIACWLAEAWTPARRIAALTLLAVGIGVQLLGCSQDFIRYQRVLFERRHPVTFKLMTSAPGLTVLYDPYDEALFAERYQLLALPPGGGEPIPVRPALAPAPISQTIYYPQSSVWAYYPQFVFDYGLIDNLWLRLARAE